MNSQRFRHFCTLIILIAFSAQAAEKMPLGDDEDIFVMTRVNPDYPDSAVKQRLGGWVLSSLVITSEGNVMDVIALDSSDAIFETPVLKALSDWKIDVLNSKIGATGSSVNIILRFQIEDKIDSASAKFAKNLGAVEKLLAEENWTKAKDQLAAISKNIKTGYDNSLYQWLSFRYFMGQQDLLAAFNALDKIFINVNVLPPDLVLPAYVARIELALNNNQLQLTKKELAKLRSAERLKSSPQYVTTIEKLDVIQAQLDAKLASSDPLAINAKIFNHYWAHTLVYTEFSISNVTGKLEGIEVRCRNAAGHHLDVIIDNGYKVPENWGECSLYIKGEVGTTFTLMEYPPTSDAPDQQLKH